ncbi:MAG: translation elongation factor Ts [Lachnospiraceae bacterium]|jgi:elongation factor Ts|nr:translation elongation factor Ts [Lachnospiraceae bacterium]
MEITAKMVKDLRETSGAGMMDCKKALAECNGDMDEAMDYLRKHGQAKAEKKAGRLAAEGLCRIAVKSDTLAAVVEVNSETDFVARNEDFQAFVMQVAEQAVNSTTDDLEVFLGEGFHAAPGKTVKDALTEKIATIGENMNIRRFARVEATEGLLATYLHGGGKIGVIIEAKSDVVNDKIKEALTNLAMQVAAMSPLHVSPDEISEEYKTKEKEILLAQALIENEQLPEEKRKNQDIIEKMLIGRLNKQFKEICLLEQVYVKAEDGKQTVAQYLQAVAKENGANLAIKRFVRFETGEGLEKREEDFAAEVAKQIAG